VKGLKVIDSSGDVTLERPAYGSIKGSDPFQPLPREFPAPTSASLPLLHNLNPDGSEIK
jgi:hypothetical protein